MKNNKGFTLVELLVTVAIFGIIVGMSIPLIGNIQKYNNQRKFDTYAQAMLASAKIYQNDYNDDLFGHKKSGCAVVTLPQLIEKKLIQDFPDKNINCSVDSSKVQIVKVGNKYGYSYQLSCGDDGDNNFVLKSWSFSKQARLKYNDDSTLEFASCDMSNGMNIIGEPHIGLEAQDDYTIKINASSSTGINPNSPISLEYAWVSLNSLEEKVNDFSTITEWSRVPNLKVPNKAKQLEKILANPSKIVESAKYTIRTPHSIGYYMLVIKVNNFQDVAGEQYPEKYKAIGPYNVSQTFKVTYDNAGGDGCSESNVPVTKNRLGTEVVNNLCLPTREGYSFLNWKDENGNDFTENTPVTRDIKLTATWKKLQSVINIYYKVSPGDTLTATTKSTDGKTIYDWSKDADGLVMRSVNKGEKHIVKTTFSPGRNVTINLANYNNTTLLNITKAGYYGIKHKEWICESGCKRAGQTFTHDQMTIANTDDICDLRDGECNIVIKVNWGDKPYCNSDGNCYDTFQSAINSTGSGKTIYLMKNNNDAGGGIFNAGKTLKYDGLGHRLNLQNPIEVKNGNVTLTNGTIIVSDEYRRAIDCAGGTLNINDNNNKAITIQSEYHTNTYMGAEAILVRNSRLNIYGSNTTIKDGKGAASAYARVISVEDNGILYMYNGTLISDATRGSQGGVGVNAEKGGKAEIHGGTVHITKMDKHNRCVFCSSANASVKIMKVLVQVDVGKSGNIFWGQNTTRYFCYQKGRNIVLRLPKNNNYLEKTTGYNYTYNIKIKC